MDENYLPEEIPDKHLKISALRTNLLEFQDEYNARLKLLNMAFIKIYDVLEKNNINPRILDNMLYELISEFEISFKLIEKKYHLSINVRVKHNKQDPHVIFSLKNLKTGFLVEEAFHIYKPESTLTAQFVMFFKNNFKSYYKS